MSCAVLCCADGPDVVDIELIEPRTVIRDLELVRKFVEYYKSRLPDMSDRPDIDPKSVQLWMKDDVNTLSRRRKSCKNPKRRYKATHSMLFGMSGKDTNNAIDFAISCNYWCVTFVDEDDDLVDLVDDCVVCTWLHYIAHLVCCFLYSTSRIYTLRQLYLSPTSPLNCTLRQLSLPSTSTPSCTLRQPHLSPTSHSYTLRQPHLSPTSHSYTLRHFHLSPTSHSYTLRQFHLSPTPHSYTLRQFHLSPTSHSCTRRNPHDPNATLYVARKDVPCRMPNRPN